MKGRATTLTMTVLITTLTMGTTLALVAPLAYAAPQWGDGAAGSPSTRTVFRTNAHRTGAIATEPAYHFQVLRNNRY
jgi:hypothetical protein